MSHDLNDILVFVKVVEHGGFSAAARVLGQPKTTVSRRVQELEARLAVPLLHRTTRKLALTEAGAAYFEHCRDLAQRLDAAEAALQQVQGEPRGWLRITAPMAFGLGALSRLLAEFRQRHPLIRIELVLSNERLDLLGHDLDLALRFGRLEDSSFVARCLGRYGSGVFAGALYAQRRPLPEHPDQLSNHEALVTTLDRRGSGFAWQLRCGQTQGSFGLDPVLIANDPSALRPALLAGHGLMLGNPLLLERYLANGSVLPVLPDWQGPVSELNALFPRGQAQSPKLRLLLDFLLQRLPQEHALAAAG